MAEDQLGEKFSVKMESREKDALSTCCAEVLQSPNDRNVEEKLENSEREAEMSNSSYSLVPLNEELIFSGNGLSDEVVGSVAGACSSISQSKKIQEVLDEAFNTLASTDDGLAEVSQLVEYMKQFADNANEYESALDELWLMFDDNKENVRVDIETFRDVMGKWTTLIQQRTSCNISQNFEENSINLISFNSRISSPTVSSRISSPVASSPIPNRQSSFGLIDPAILFNCSFGSMEGIGGDVSKLDQIELAAELKEMQHQNKKLHERIAKLLNQIGSAEENNSLLVDENEQLNKRLSCFQSSAIKTKDLEKLNTKLNDKILKSKAENLCLQKRIDDLKKENLSLESKIENMKEDLSLTWADLEQAKSSNASLKLELDNLHVKIEQMELTIEIKDAKLLEEVQRNNENDRLVFFWRNKSESSTTEKDRLEMELAKALDNIDQLKRKYKLAVEAQINEGAKISLGSCFESVQCIEKAGSLYSPLSLRQELETVLCVEDNLPSPFCEKNFLLNDSIEVESSFVFSDGYHTEKMDSHSNMESFKEKLSLGEDGDEGVVDGSDEDIVDQNRKMHTKHGKSFDIKWIELILQALKIILAAKREAESLSNTFQNLERGTNLRYRPSEIGFRKLTGTFKEEKGNGDAAENDCQSVNFKRNERNELFILSTLLEDSNSVLNENQEILSEEFQSTLCETFSDECQNLQALLHTFNLTKQAIDLKPTSLTNVQSHSSNSVWGKSKNLSQIFSVPEDIYKRLLSKCELKNIEVAVSSMESQFNKLLLTIFERRQSVQQRLHQHKHQLRITRENLDSKLLKLKLAFGGCFEKNREEEWYTFENLLFTVNKEFENYGKVQEEVDMFGFVDKLIQYFENDNLISRNISRENVTCHASVQCQNNDFTDSDNGALKPDRIRARSSQSANAISSRLHKFYHIFNCRSARFYEVFWNLSSDSSTSSKCFTFVGVFTVIAFAVICYLLTNSGDTCSNCPSNLNHAVYGKTWSEFLKPYAQKQNSPQIF